ncbi:c-type cytochrome [Suttonella sp. R2A3]|uniref:cytochrome-c peroxidase n=1 Tax=Suttonella sp. R2A3 TaxID=2908648 RepID=UPI001F168C5D|nr:cytochrome c peroxidase [Suttonella sp. R2A3]UJF25099.1 c-type cytochrome [Suttonella sp. R2A3]
MKQAIIIALAISSIQLSFGDELTEADLGQLLFFDANLSLNRSQSCSTCHDPARAFTDGRETAALGIASLGDDGHSFGNRNAPTAAYANTSPAFHYDEALGEYVGGQFWDGRAATLADQAAGPPLNPAEMGMPDTATVFERLNANAVYKEAFPALYGEAVLNDPDTAYQAMTQAIQAFEQTELFSPYDSKYDRFLRGEYELTVLEDLGRTLFFSEANVNCSTCHMLKREDAAQEPFTNHQYRNIGVPSNPNIIAAAELGEAYIDHGLLENPAVDDATYDGKIKTPTLRNVAITGPYMHNGVFKDLRTVVEFYDKYNNTERTINPETGEPWREAEVPGTIDLDDLRAQKLTERKIDALVAFMKTLTDARYEYLLEEK